ncbi:hypothetical protein AKJ66_00445 [candidate division MSBL1 archaeon SCGC-AAA259E22]|uniref:SpoVT-AbrB domain-containing protein n=1 Tax=candidate division MSBL1 archaeon SCGC-AAA259E22 TaxID=1698265 RepID=A0A133UI69_9EURY|nr:hypothetical protein AKJ66_00445 [candidate division MSBL1 archaeon SCGC-AAA259E22]
MSENKKTVRKVLQIGECTGITLPVTYLRKTGLERGDHVEFLSDDNKGIILPIHSKEDNDGE